MKAKFKNGAGNFTLRAAALIIQDDQILLAKSDAHDCFYTVGGEIKQNEASDKAILRECYEETGHHFEIDRLVFVQERFYILANLPHHEVTFFYLMKKNDFEIYSGVNTDQNNEHLYWIPMEKLESTNIAPEFLRKALNDLPARLIHIISYE